MTVQDGVCKTANSHTPTCWKHIFKTSFANLKLKIVYEKDKYIKPQNIPQKDLSLFITL